MKSIFITGASAGIGKATAILFADKGWLVGAADVDEAGLGELKMRMAGKIGFTAVMDVTDAERVAAVLRDFTRTTGGTIDVLFNNAGILRINPFETIPLEEQHAILNINNKGVLNCTYHAFPYLKNTKGARVINMASTAAIIPSPTEATYSASKFWVRGFTEALNMEWKRYDIHVCDIMPSFVDTPMVKHNPGEIVDNVGISLSAEQIAETVWRASAGKRVHWIIDSTINKLFFNFRGILPSKYEQTTMTKLAGLS
jgi:NADP-dependent 3-hydroxy acid dehydrogenase YdfG